jgi:hypothetical protein
LSTYQKLLGCLIFGDKFWTVECLIFQDGGSKWQGIIYDIGYLHGENKLCVYKISWGMVLASYWEMAWLNGECHDVWYVWSHGAYRWYMTSLCKSRKRLIDFGTLDGLLLKEEACYNKRGYLN